jgi:hypothetical protein
MLVNQDPVRHGIFSFFQGILKLQIGFFFCKDALVIHDINNTVQSIVDGHEGTMDIQRIFDEK